jgi:hypothetical protein
LYRKITISSIQIVASMLMVAHRAAAATVPFTETFSANSPNWFDSLGVDRVFALGGAPTRPQFIERGYGV